MLSKTNNYILGLHPETTPRREVLGNAGIDYLELSKNNLPLPESFVITPYAFDDFLTAADLLDEVGELLEEISGTPENAQEVSEKIKKLIMQTNYPSIVLNPILQAYKNISGFTDKFIRLQPSWILPKDLIPTNSTKEHTKIDVRGDASLLYAIKQIWVALFSPEALILRYQSQYDGELSIAVLVQKEIQAETFGSVYYPARHPEYHEVPLAEVTALMGTADNGDPNLHPDIYLVDTDQDRILEKHVTTQKYMFLRQGTSRGKQENKLFKVDISKDWQDRQKLDDGHLLDLALVAKHGGDAIRGAVEFNWALEADKLYVTSLRRVEEFRAAEEDLQTKIDRLVDPQSEEQLLGEGLEITPLPPEEKKKVDFDELMQEVEALSSELAEELEFMEEAEPVMEDFEHEPEKERVNIAAYDIPLKLYLDVSELTSTELTFAQQFDGAYFDATEMVVGYSTLPEAIEHDKAQLRDLIENYAADIATVAKVVEPHPILYSFSNLNEKHYVQLEAQKFFSPEVNGSERFLEKPEALRAELAAVKKARNQMSARNISLVLPYLRSESELVQLKKILNSEGFKRTQTLELWLEVSTPSLLHEIEQIQSQDADGLVVNVRQLLQHMTGRKELMEKDLEIAFRALSKAVSERSFKLQFRIPPTPIMLDKMQKFKFIPSGLILDEYPDVEFMEALQRFSAKPALQLKTRPSLGRPVKPLYG